MDYVKPNTLIKDVALSGKVRSELSAKQIILRGFISGFFFTGALLHYMFKK